MNAAASPRPWRVDRPSDECRFWVCRNPDGVSVGTMWREADAALIVDAVNNIDRLRDELDVERSQHATDIEQAEYHAEHHRKSLEAECDRLRDLVRRMATQLSRSCPEKFGDWTRPGDNACSLVREARAAIGEGEP